MSVSISPSDFSGEKSALLSIPPSWEDYFNRILDLEKGTFKPSDLEVLYRRTLRALLHIEDIPSEFELDLEDLDPIFQVLVGVLISNFHTVGRVAANDYRSYSSTNYQPADPNLVSKFTYKHLFSLPVEHEVRVMRLLKFLLSTNYSHLFEKSDRLSFKNNTVNLRSYRTNSLGTVTDEYGNKVTLSEYVREYLENRGAKITSDLECDIAVVQSNGIIDRNTFNGRGFYTEDIYFNKEKVRSSVLKSIYESTGVSTLNGTKGYYINEDLKGKLIARLRKGILPVFQKMVDQGIYLSGDRSETEVLTDIVSQFECYIKGLESVDKLLIPVRFFNRLCHEYAPILGFTFGAELFNMCFSPLDSSKIYLDCPIAFRDSFIYSPDNFIRATNKDVIRLTPEALIQKAKQYYQNQAVKKEKSIDKLDIDQNDKEVLENIFTSLQSTDSDTLIFTFSLLEKLAFSFDTAVSVGSLLMCNPRCTLLPDTYIVHNIVPEVILSKFKPYKIRIKTTNKETFIKSVLKVDPNMIHTNVYFRRCIIDHFVPTYS